MTYALIFDYKIDRSASYRCQFSNCRLFRQLAGLSLSLSLSLTLYFISTLIVTLLMILDLRVSQWQLLLNIEHFSQGRSWIFVAGGYARFLRDGNLPAGSRSSPQTQNLRFRFMKRVEKLYFAYTPCSKKNQAPWCLIITLANVDRFSKFFHQVIRKNILYHKNFHLACNMLLHYLVKVGNPKMLLTLTAPQQSADLFLRPENTLRTWFNI